MAPPWFPSMHPPWRAPLNFARHGKLQEPKLDSTRMASAAGGHIGDARDPTARYGRQWRLGAACSLQLRGNGGGSRGPVHLATLAPCKRRPLAHSLRRGNMRAPRLNEFRGNRYGAAHGSGSVALMREREERHDQCHVTWFLSRAPGRHD